MVIKDRIKILFKGSNIHAFLYIGLIYGFFTGCFTQIIRFFQNDISFSMLIEKSITVTLIYCCFFSSITLLVLISLHIKTYISLGLDRKSVANTWSDLIIGISLLYSLSAIIIIIIINIKKPLQVPKRYFNMQFYSLNFINYIEIFVFVFFVALFINMIISFIANTGNAFGWMICTSTIFIVIGFIFYFILPIIELISWGSFILPFSIIIIILDIVLYIINKKMIYKTEVVR